MVTSLLATALPPIVVAMDMVVALATMESVATSGLGMVVVVAIVDMVVVVGMEATLEHTLEQLPMVEAIMVQSPEATHTLDNF